MLEEVLKMKFVSSTFEFHSGRRLRQGIDLPQTFVIIQIFPFLFIAWVLASLLCGQPGALPKGLFSSSPIKTGVLGGSDMNWTSPTWPFTPSPPLLNLPYRGMGRLPRIIGPTALVNCDLRTSLPQKKPTLPRPAFSRC
ncbi:hypothetical protein AVEN_87115-1 [Araneus ventricosus]|uniref:Uncharacterized protein n=1 Tax=Araneus ventricosus TaxID=182803 RepID=A0A4Y2HKD0_ARAVE|nr:hypothetical protein AVEN_87115-1 [Araneus ventricosus]